MKLNNSHQEIDKSWRNFVERIESVSSNNPVGPIPILKPWLVFLPSFFEFIRVMSQTKKLQSESSGRLEFDLCVSSEINQWSEVMIEFLIRLLNDWQCICKEFGGFQNSDAKLNQVWIAGDRHAFGRTVLITQFSNGTCLVYKPTSQTMFLRFQILKEWLNSKLQNLKLKQVAGIDRENYAWIEYVPFQTCRSEKMVGRFYKRAGTSLALFQLLQATDLHSQNLIASGEYPVFIDLETLFQPRILDPSDFQRNPGMLTSLADSVSRVGLLPSSSGLFEKDISSLGARARDRKTFRSKDKRRVDFATITKPPFASNRPTINNRAVKASDYSEDFITEFARTYRLLVRYREQLLQKDHLLPSFKNLTNRIVLRPTIEYAVLLKKNRDQSRSGFSNALEKMNGIRTFMKRVVELEVDALTKLDVPMFSSRPDSVDIIASNGKTIPGFLVESGYAFAKRRLEQMNDSDLKIQIELIRKCFLACYQ